VFGEGKPQNNILPKPRKVSPVNRDIAMELWKETYLRLLKNKPEAHNNKIAIHQANSAVDAFFEKFNENK